MMPVTRRDVLERLAAASDASRGEMTTTEALASSLDAEEDAIVDHIEGLVSCELALWRSDGAVRVTITGEELLQLDTEDGVIVDTPSRSTKQ